MGSSPYSKYRVSSSPCDLEDEDLISSLRSYLISSLSVTQSVDQELESVTHTSSSTVDRSLQ